MGWEENRVKVEGCAGKATTTHFSTCGQGGGHSEDSTPVVAQVGEHVVEQTGDERHCPLLLITPVNHVQEGCQNLEQGPKKTETF